VVSSLAHADVPENSGKANEGRTAKPEEDDFTGTPFTEYGEFNESNDEDEDARFFKHGRFFGASLGLGFEFLDGNRGALWQGGFPMVDFKLHYWFNFNLALDIGFFTASHFFESTALSGLGKVDVNILHVGLDIKYYFETKNLSAPISFANPYVLVGAGSFSKTQNSIAQPAPDTDNSLGISGGGGLEFAMVPRKSYFAVEAKVHTVKFRDTYTEIYKTSNNLPDLTGLFYTFSASILFTW
jgi:hypothetical protein